MLQKEDLKGYNSYMPLCPIQPSDKSYSANNMPTCCRTEFPIELENPSNLYPSVISFEVYFILKTSAQIFYK